MLDTKLVNKLCKGIMKASVIIDIIDPSIELCIDKPFGVVDLIIKLKQFPSLQEFRAYKVKYMDDSGYIHTFTLNKKDIICEKITKGS